VIVVSSKISNLSSIPWQEQVTFDEIIMLFALKSINTLSWNFSATSLKKQSQQLILILNQSVAALSPKCSMLSGEVTNTNLTVFGLNNVFAGVYSSI
jgi:hypothetical protein